MSNKNNSLEIYIVEKLKLIDSEVRLTKGSGCGNECLDISTWVGFFECRQDHNKSNWIIQRKKDWLYSLSKLPINVQKELFIVKENKFGEKMITMEAEAFFRLLYKLYGGEK